MACFHSYLRDCRIKYYFAYHCIGRPHYIFFSIFLRKKIYFQQQRWPPSPWPFSRFILFSLVFGTCGDGNAGWLLDDSGFDWVMSVRVSVCVFLMIKFYIFDAIYHTHTHNSKNQWQRMFNRNVDQNSRETSTDEYWVGMRIIFGWPIMEWRRSFFPLNRVESYHDAMMPRCSPFSFFNANLAHFVLLHLPNIVYQFSPIRFYYYHLPLLHGNFSPFLMMLVIFH